MTIFFPVFFIVRHRNSGLDYFITETQGIAEFSDWNENEDTVSHKNGTMTVLANRPPASSVAGYQGDMIRTRPLVIRKNKWTV